MDGIVETAEELAARELAADRERIDRQLGEPLTPQLESALREERRWVERRRRLLERVKVSCDALLFDGPASQPVVLRDITAMGVGLDAARPPDVGARVRIAIPAISGRPVLDAVVRHACPELRRVGLEFVPAGDETRRVAEEMVQRFRSYEDG